MFHLFELHWIQCIQSARWDAAARSALHTQIVSPPPAPPTYAIWEFDSLTQDEMQVSNIAREMTSEPIHLILNK